MTLIEKDILKLLKENKSQNAIANELGVPRSLVQRVSDAELGVDPSSLKSLTTDQIVQIQKDSAEGANNTFLAKVHNVSAKTIARALMVRVQRQANNVEVLSPIKADDCVDYEVQDGGVAHDKEGIMWYVGAYLGNHNKYLALRYEGSSVVAVRAFNKLDLSVNTAKECNLSAAAVGVLAEVSTALTKGYDQVSKSLEISVVVEGDEHPMTGSLDSRLRVGYINALMRRTYRLALSSVVFRFKQVEVSQEADLDEKETKSDFSSKDLDVFLNEHQILILPNSIVIAIDGKPETITTSHQAYDRIVQAIKDKDIKLAYELMKPREAIAKFASGMVIIDGKTVTWDKFPITNTSVARRALKLAIEGDHKNLGRLVKFMDKMFQNPSAALVQSGRIYDFMAYSDIEIDDDGDIILYKSVRGNYMDKHSNTISNAPGTIVRMARSFVNDDNSDLCSYGLHVCSLAYLKQCFGSVGQRVVRCKLNPKDIVSITNDYKSSKIRCCEYLVLDDYTSEYNRQYKSIDVDGLYR